MGGAANRQERQRCFRQVAKLSACIETCDKRERFPRKDGLTVHVVSVDVLAACTFVAFGDDLTPPGLVLLLADILVKQAI